MSTKQQNKGTPKKFITPTSNNNQPSLADIMQAIHQLGEKIKGIKTEMTKMDTRIGYLEDDAFYNHMEQEEEILMEDEEMPIFLRPQTPSEQLQSEDEGSLSYKRKRQARSPAQEICQEQNMMYSRIDAMGTTLNRLAKSFSQLETIANRSTSTSTIPPKIFNE